MNLADAITDAPSHLYDSDMAVDVTYNGSRIHGHLEREHDNGDSKVRKLSGRLHVKKSDVASPAYRDTAIISSITWRVIPPVPVDETPFDWVLAVEAGVRPLPGR